MVYKKMAHLDDSTDLDYEYVSAEFSSSVLFLSRTLLSTYSLPVFIHNKSYVLSSPSFLVLCGTLNHFQKLEIFVLLDSQILKIFVILSVS